MVIRWALQRGFAVIPKSTNPERQAENLEALEFELSEAEIQQIDALSANRKVAWNPKRVA